MRERQLWQERKQDHAQSKAVDEAKNRRRSTKQRQSSNLSTKWGETRTEGGRRSSVFRKIWQGASGEGRGQERVPRTAETEGNSLGNSGRQALGAALAAASTLTSLDLGSCGITVAGAVRQSLRLR